MPGRTGSAVLPPGNTGETSKHSAIHSEGARAHTGRLRPHRMGIDHGSQNVSPNAIEAIPLALLLCPCRHLLARWTRGRSRIVGACRSWIAYRGIHGLQRIRSFTWHQLATAGPKCLRHQLLKLRFSPARLLTWPQYTERTPLSSGKARKPFRATEFMHLAGAARARCFRDLGIVLPSEHRGLHNSKTLQGLMT